MCLKEVSLEKQAFSSQEGEIRVSVQNFPLLGQIALKDGLRASGVWAPGDSGERTNLLLLTMF